LEEKDTLRVFLDFYMGYNWYSRIGEESEYLLLWEKGFLVFSILEHSEITKITLDFKTHVFVFRGMVFFGL
jgi:hypothetical protein